MITLLYLVGNSFVFAETTNGISTDWNFGQTPTTVVSPYLLKCSTETPLECQGGTVEESSYDMENKVTTRKCKWINWESITCTLKDTEYAPAKQTLWIGLSPECLVHGGCSLDVYKTLWIRENSPKETRTSVLSLFQDAIGAATFFIGTIVTIAFVWAWFKFVLAWRNGDSSGRSSAQQGMIYAIIGLILVMSSYAIIRLVQYIASTQ